VFAHPQRRARLAVGAIAGAAALTAAGTVATATPSGATTPATATPIRHLVVVFDENVSFDHYFGTYPRAANPPGEPAFSAAAGTPTVNGLTRELLTHNPNLANPQRLDRSEALTCDQNHDYGPEQQAFNKGLMNRFVQDTDVSSCSPPDVSKPALVMDYYDGNTVTALWNYAQRFAMSDNSFGTTFGPSTPGAVNLVSGQTHGATLTAPDPTSVAHGTVIGDPDPTLDDCSAPGYATAMMSGSNVGDLLNARGVSWGWFQGGFRPSTRATATSPAVCGAAHTNVGGALVTDYSAHHEPFQYYRSTANRHHLAPASVAEIGHAGRANHQYDLSDLYAALHAGSLPAVSFVKAAKYQDGHAGYSDPLDEQHFFVRLLNSLQSSPEWRSTAVVIAYDDSDGWYDHQMSPIVNHSDDPSNDFLTGPGHCGSGSPKLGGFEDRCGYGPRLPLLVLSPYSRVNAIDHTITDQSSVLRFIEENWRLGEIGGGSFDRIAGPLTGLFDFGRPKYAPLILSPATGEPVR